MRRGERIRIGIRALAASVAVAAIAAGAARADGAMTLEAAVRRALERSPSILEAKAGVDAARAARAGAKRLFQDNPELEISAGPRKRDEVETSDYEVSVQQALDFSGRRFARADAAEAALAAAEARLVERNAAVAAQVREAFGRALAADARNALAGEALELAAQASAAAEERYQAGAASLIELNSARVEHGRRQRAKLAAERSALAAVADLALLLGIEPARTLAIDGELPSQSSMRAMDASALPSLAARAREKRGDVIAARANLDAARGEARLAAREAIPAPRLGAGFGKEEDADVARGTLSIDLPLFDRNQAARGMSRARVAQAQAALEAIERSVQAEVELAVSRYATARLTLVGFADDVLAAAEQNVELASEGYDAGQLDFLHLLLIRREMIEARADFIDAREEMNSAEAELDRALGVVTGLPEE